MADQTVEQARLHKEEIIKRIDRLNREIEITRAAVARAEADLAYMNGYIAATEKISQRSPKKKRPEPRTDGDSLSRRVMNPPRERVVDEALSLIREAGEPLSRQVIFDKLQARGVVIEGKNPLMILSTMLWRTPKRIVRLRGHGYWPADIPYEPASHDPAAAQRELF